MVRKTQTLMRQTISSKEFKDQMLESVSENRIWKLNEGPAEQRVMDSLHQFMLLIFNLL